MPEEQGRAVFIELESADVGAGAGPVAWHSGSCDFGVATCGKVCGAFEAANHHVREWESPRSIIHYRKMKKTLPSLTLRPRSKIKSTSRFKPLGTLSSQDISTFQASYFQPELPVIFPRGHFSQLPAIQKWFSTPTTTTFSSSADNSNTLAPSSLNYVYLEKHSDCSVPVEFTFSQRPDSPETLHFQRLHTPLGLFLKWTKTTQHNAEGIPPNAKLYLAQCQLLDLPPELRLDLPTPPLVLEAGKGDIYDTNIWMGVPPTYTPLHRDPNPNLFVQMAGRKIVRLDAPDTGLVAFERVRESILRRQKKDASANIGGITVGDAKFRGEEMMQGLENRLLEREVWGDTMEIGVDGEDTEDTTEIREGFEAHLNAGDGMFIPMGWWHSIKGVGEGITASVNWWFR
ncbi:JmjC domain-containing protein [Histoplasma capsulatum var. duboisii H88]|uniref:JmjC domain-containing protein n=3 Tax=Ajellomyces capsulatus TaxID=5037 RepID=F0U4Q1_AJEC8|nr:JmjC domain-containing protein [Histoplasma capsulatum H143]EGC41998.1 JmjC domain-containing protein [Histoplasma capsulatum var. duboisii H88]